MIWQGMQIVLQEMLPRAALLAFLIRITAESAHQPAKSWRALGVLSVALLVTAIWTGDALIARAHLSETAAP